ncbi:MAG: glycerol dehydratase reactivase beta/small subunit family protein [Fusobacterium gastrosuis]|uniref:glycerol dehydratase reactivase beta/small subunit family protein n=1 Tax=Fusobacterium gastrosuis TaxID=1755100 RepID=UPI002A9FA5E3|nr:glycerol dehydratase reactivase beta/small subunit family protein [Fusobacteriaceae bacterium]MDY5794741.1 glycerol dehydratase reactivase beta/small subunit family protein [Fusobacterium gastrosuis]
MDEFIGIHIHINKKIASNSVIKSIFWGIEEEGIPYKTYEIEEGNSDSLGYEASKISRLGVGIGVDDNYITLYYEKLNLGEALFKYKTLSKENILRSLGKNAARLIKGEPFTIPKD